MCDPTSFAIVAGAVIASGSGGGGSSAGTASEQSALRSVELTERQFAMEEPFRKRGLEAGIAAIGRGEELAQKELPLQLQVIDEAAVAGLQEEQDAAAARAASDAHAAIDATGATRARTLTSLGIKPGDPAYTAGSRSADAANAATLASAATHAREGERVRGQEQRIRVAGQARGFNPNVSTTDPSRNLLSAAGTLNTIAGQQYQQDQTARTAIGQAIGGIGERFFKPASTVPPQTALSNSYNSTPFVNSGYADFEKGGEVRGPSHPEGGVPIEAEGGEFVIKADTVRKYGPRLLAEVNEGTAIIIPTGSPRRLRAVA